MSANNSYPDLIEILAEYAHNVGVDWMSLFLQHANRPTPKETVESFERMINTEYSDLSENGKKASRYEARVILAMIVKALYEIPWISEMAKSWDRPFDERMGK